MCGISGIISFDKKIPVAQAIVQMNRAIAHRGPDGEGFVLINETETVSAFSEHTPENIIRYPFNFSPKKHINQFTENYLMAFGHRRLSIIDLAPSGHQPMCTEDEHLWITYNGEIYNYIEIREELKTLGHSFKTNSDTEIILHAYLQWGKHCLDRLNGMWAFVIYDKQNNKLFGARDRFGVKPFYYYHKNNLFCFASEQKAIHVLPQVETELNSKVAYDFFLHSELEYQTEGFFKNIVELFPSTFFELNLSTQELEVKKYYELKTTTNNSIYTETEFNTLKEKTSELFYNAVRLRLRADVPVGSCLSGGIDSSAIVGAMNKILFGQEQKINLFSAVFPQQTIDESKWAKLVANNTHSIWHTTTPTSQELFNDLNDLIYSQDIPLWSTSTYAQYRVMKLASQNNIKVVLDGQGGDELFSGYLPYFSWYWGDLAAGHQWKTLHDEMKAFSSLSKGIDHFTREKIKNYLQQGKLSFLKSLKNKELKYYHPDFIEQHKHHERQRKQHVQDPKTLNEKLLSEFSNTRLKAYLKCEDRCGMRWSVESRTPFADDIHLIESVFATPGVYKMKNGTTKYLMREALQQFLPKEIYARKDKMGYVTPNNKWLYEMKEEIKPFIDDKLKGIIDTKKFLKDFDEILSKNFTKENPFVFKVLAFAIWRRNFKL